MMEMESWNGIGMDGNGLEVMPGDSRGRNEMPGDSRARKCDARSAVPGVGWNGNGMWKWNVGMELDCWNGIGMLE